MPAVDDVLEEGLGLLEPSPLLAQLIAPLSEDCSTIILAAVQKDAYLDEAEPDVLAGAQNLHPSHMLLGVLAVAGAGAIRSHHVHVVPVTEHMWFHTDEPGSLRDAHGPMLAGLQVDLKP